MNLVAHQFLSFNNPPIQLGNLLGEVVKGNKFNDYPTLIKEGILLHREIDHFTDQHEIVKHSTSYFHSTQHKYAPILIDLMFDYFLIKHWHTFHPTSFHLFKENCYELFNFNYKNFPPKLQYMLDHLLKHDWFENYTTMIGIQQTLNGISKRANFKNNLSCALSDMLIYETEIEKDFLIFFPQLVTHCKEYLQLK